MNVYKIGVLVVAIMLPSIAQPFPAEQGKGNARNSPSRNLKIITTECMDEAKDIYEEYVRIFRHILPQACNYVILRLLYKPFVARDVFSLMTVQ